MRLLHLSIRGFGELRGEYVLEAGEGRLGLLLERNEAGKTTLVEAVLAALYGLDRDKRKARGRLTDWERFRPWSGNAYGLSLLLSHRGEELTIERDFKEDSVRVLQGGRDLTDRYRSGRHVLVGETLLGLSRAQFLHCAFVRQGEVAWGDASGLGEALQRVADSGTGESTAAQALAALRKGLDEYEGLTLAGRGKVDTEIHRCREQIEATRRKLDALLTERERLGRRIDELQDSEVCRAARERRSQEIELARLELEKEEIEAALTADDTLRAQLDELERLDREQAGLLEVAESDLDAAESLYQRWVGARRTAESYLKDAVAAEEEWEEARKKVESFGLARPPRAEDLEALVQARTRIADAQRDLERLLENARREKQAIEAAGFTPEQAESMLTAFQYLTDDDRQLLESRMRESLSIDEQRQRLREELSQWQRRHDDLERARARRRRDGGLIAAAGALLLAGGLLAGGSLGLPFPLPQIAGGVVVVLGLYRLVSAGRWRNAEESLALDQMKRCADEIHEIEERNQEHEVAWQDLAHRLGIERDQLEGRYRELRSVESHLSALQGIEERRQEARTQEESALAASASAWELFGEEPSVEHLEERLERLRAALKAQGEAEAAADRLKTQQALADEKKLAWIQRRGELRETLAACGIEVSEKATVEEIEEAAGRLKELHRQRDAARRRREEELPKLRAEVLTSEERSRRQKRREELTVEIERRRAEGIEPVELTGEWVFSRRRAELDELAEKLLVEERSEARRREDSLTEVRAFLQKYEDQAPGLWSRLEQLQRALRRATEFRDAVTLAIDDLEAISRETYHDWAARLNREASLLLEKLGTGSRELRFGEDLRFQLQHGDKLLDAVEIDQQLSTGARDGVYLAARLAVSRLLGGEDHLPLILDDPFAHCDDERLLEGMRLLLDAAREQQVLLLACQHSRYEWAKERLGFPREVVELGLGE